MEYNEQEEVPGRDEYELIRACRRNDRQAQEALYGLYSRRMFFVCLRYSRHRQEAEDLMQEGFIRVFTRLNDFRMEGSLEGWVRRIMIRTCINHVRKKSVNHEVLGTDDLPDHSVAPMVISELGREELLRLVQELPDGYRAVFNLYAIDGYDHREIAEMMGYGESTSRSQLAKARRMLQRRMEEMERIGTR